MKTFKQFCESVKSFPSSPSKLTPGKGYPLGVPFINLKKDMENKIFKWQTSKLSDDDINKLYKDRTNPKKPKEPPLDPYAIPVKKA